MADRFRGAGSSSSPNGKVKVQTADKRHFTESSDDDAPSKKVSMSWGGKPKPASLGPKISFNLGSTDEVISSKASPVLSKPAKPLAPVKLSLNPSQKSKEPPPVVQKSAVAASVFDDSDESDDEEMPPEARMRMKNIGRETPTAAGPNSYGKGKQGFIDRQKIYEKQLKEDMEKVSGDNSLKAPPKLN